MWGNKEEYKRNYGGIRHNKEQNQYCRELINERQVRSSLRTQVKDKVIRELERI